MATYLTLNSKFTPYTYEEILKPYLDRQEALEKKMTTLEELLTSTSLWDGILDETNDSEYYRAFLDFNNRLEDVAGALSNGDASAITNKDIHNMKMEYTKTFAPLTKKYEELVAEQTKQKDLLHKAAAAGKHIMVTNDLSTTSLTLAMTNPSYNQYDIIDLDNIMEQAMTKGATYGKNAAYYSVFGDKYGNTLPKQEAEELNTLVQLLIPSSVTDNKQREELTNLIIKGFLLGASDSYSKDIADINKSNNLISLGWSNYRLNRLAQDTETLMAIGLTINYDNKGNIIAKDAEGNIVSAEEVLRRVTEYNKIKNPGTATSAGLTYDTIAKYYYIENSDGTRVYYKDAAGKSPIEMYEGDYIQLKENRFYNYKNLKIYTKNPDGVLVPENTTHSEGYHSSEKLTKRILAARTLSSDELQDLNTVYNKDSNNIIIYSGEQLHTDSNLSDEDKKLVTRKIIQTGYDPQDLIIVYRSDKSNYNKKQVTLIPKPEVYYNVTGGLNLDDVYSGVELYDKGIKDYIKNNYAIEASAEEGLSGDGKVEPIDK